MPTDDERRAVARRLRRSRSEWSGMGWRLWLGPKFCAVVLSDGNRDELEDAAHRLADLIEPSYKPDAEYETWYNGLSHFGDERGGPSTIRELIEEIVWAALTVDLGPNGNTGSTGVDEGRVYTDSLFAEWEREALRLSGSIDRDALLALADELSGDTLDVPAVYGTYMGGYVAACRDVAHRIREALGVDDG